MDKNLTISNKLIFGKFKLLKKIGEGSFGKVYSGLNEKTQEPVAIKLEPKKAHSNCLKSEALYIFMLKDVGIPTLKAFGTYKNYNILVENLLGDSLSFILKKYKIISLKDSLMIAIQVIERLEYIHSKYLIHRDIKPANFLIGREDPYLIYLIDFGLTKKYRSARTGKHVKFKVTNYYNGTFTFASINSLRGIEVSRRDDLISAAYMFIYLMKGSLPWDSIRGKNLLEKHNKIIKMKKLYKPEELCKNLPKEIMEFLLYCKNLNFEQEPDYKYCYSLFNNALIKHGYSNDLIFSWINDYKIKDKLRKMNDNRNLTLGISKRRSSPQTRLYNLLLKSSESQKSMQSSKVYDNLNNSKNNEYRSNSYKSPLNKSHFIFGNNSIMNDDISNKKRIIKSILEQDKKYRKILVESISNINNSSGKKLSVNTLPNLQKSNTIINIENTKKKTEIKMPNFTSRNERKKIISFYNFNDTSKENYKKNSINNKTIDPFNNINYNNKNYQSFYDNLNKIEKINNNGKIKFIKIIQNNIINKDINMIINSNNKKYKEQNNRKNLINNGKQAIKVGLNDLLLKYQLKHLNHKLFFKDNNKLLKHNYISYKTLENISINKSKENESRYLNLSKKNLSKHFETINSNFTRKRIIINTNRNNNSKFKRIKYIQKINFGQNSYSPLKQNNKYNHNKIQYENKLDTRRINKNSTFKNVLRLNNDFVNKGKKIEDYILNYSQKKLKPGINSKNNQFTYSNNISYIYKSKIYNSMRRHLVEELKIFNNTNKYLNQINDSFY